MSNKIQQFVNDLTFKIMESDFVISRAGDEYELRGMDFTISAKDSQGRRWEGRTITWDGPEYEEECDEDGEVLAWWYSNKGKAKRRAEAEAMAASPDLNDFEFVGHSYGSQLWDDEDERRLAYDDHEYQV